MPNLKDKYLSTVPGRLGTVQIDGWGTVHLRPLTLAEAEYIGDLEKANDSRAGIVLFLKTVVDQYGQRVFGDEDEALVKDFPIQTVVSVGRAALELSQCTPEKVEAAKKD